MKSWIRLYTEVPDDPKVQSLPAELFRFWINLLCLVGRHEGRIPETKTLSWALRTPYDECLSNLEKLRIAGLIDGNQPHSWKKRQYESDSSTGRVKRFRERFETVSQAVPLSVSVSVSDSVSEKEKKDEKIISRIPVLENWQRDELYLKFQESYRVSCDSPGSSDWADGYRAWGILDWDQRSLAIAHASTAGAFISLPSKYLQRHEWDRKPRIQPKNGSKSLTAEEIAAL